MKTKILITGGRDFTDINFIDSILDTIYEDYDGEISLILGGASGTDTLAQCWGSNREVDHQVIYAKWKKYGRKMAGPIRNKEMADQKPDFAIAFPGGIGTANMKKVCKENNIKIVEPEYYKKLNISHNRYIE